MDEKGLGTLLPSPVAGQGETPADSDQERRVKAVPAMDPGILLRRFWGM